MIHSLFMMNSHRDIFMEKHWKSAIKRSVCDFVFEALEKASSPEDLPPVIATPHHYLISIYRERLYFVSVVSKEIQPLFVIEFLHRIVDTFIDYFGECSESAIKENYVVVYELLEEMLDNGYPLATESNILKELIKPPNILRSVVNTVTGQSNVADKLPKGQLSNVPWRRTGVKYTSNEAYFDITEEVDAIIDRSGSTVFAEIQGSIDATVKLSGMPDLTLSFVNSRLLDDVSFHPCVRYKRWEADRVLSFIPPDGNFKLCSYHVGAQGMTSIPIYIRHNIQYTNAGGKFEVTIGPRHTMGKVIEDLKISAFMPKQVLNINLFPTQGDYTFNPVDKEMIWEVGKIVSGKPPSIRGSISLQSGVPAPEEKPTLTVNFKIQQLSISGLRVNRLDMHGERYKPFKGVKYITTAGKFQVRT
ncbi:AP-3 complex subunit mu-1-like [Clavelina lepadiformis]